MISNTNNFYFYLPINAGIQLTKTNAALKCKTTKDCALLCEDGKLKCEKGECKCEIFGSGADGQRVDGEGLGHCKTTADCDSYPNTCLYTKLICDKGTCICSTHFGHENHNTLK